MQRSAELQSPGLLTCLTTLHKPSKTADVCSVDTAKKIYIFKNYTHFLNCLSVVLMKRFQ